MSLIYLASPYSHPNEAVRFTRFMKAQEFCARELQLGVPIFSPIVYCWQFEQKYKLPGDADYWKDLNLAWLRASTALWILKLDGWQDSAGINFEAREAGRMGMVVVMKEPVV